MRRLLFGLSAVLALCAALAAQKFTPTGSMTTPRAGAAAVLLQSGKVLIIGGVNAGQVLASAELYDPASGTFAITGSMAVARTGPQAVLLPSGKVLVVGGEAGPSSSTSELYDPLVGTFMAGPALPVPLTDPLAVGLADGRVWITGAGPKCAAGTGGAPPLGCTSPIEIYDPKSGAVSVAGHLESPASRESITALADGDVLVAGVWCICGAISGSGGATIYNETGSVVVEAKGDGFDVIRAAARLKNGQILLTGDPSLGPGSLAEIYDPKSNSLSSTAGPPSGTDVVLVGLPDGTALASDGHSAQIYNPQLGTFSDAGALPNPASTATLLPDGTVLLTGERGDEIFTPSDPAPDFSLSTDTTKVSISSGSTATFKLTASGTNGFNDAIALACTNAGSAACMFVPATIKAGDTATLTVGALDTSKPSTLKFEVTATSGSLSHALNLEIDIQPPVATLSPTSLSFASQNVGTTSDPRTITLGNGGAVDIAISGIAAQGDFKETNNCGATIASGKNCTITVTFAPTASGPRAGSIQISDNAPDSPQTITLTGTAVAVPAPVVSLSPTGLSFGNETVGSTSSPQTITINNTGNADLTIQSLSASGDFAQTNNCGTTVAAGKSCSAAITFAPGSNGDKTGSFSVTDNASGSPQTAVLTGTGQPAAAPGVTLSPTSLSFPDQAVGTTSTAQTVTVTNNGTANLVFTVIATTGDFRAPFDSTNPCRNPLPVGKTCTMDVMFLPTAAGDRTGGLFFYDDASGSPQVATLTGKGTVPAVPPPSSPGGVSLDPSSGASLSATIAAGKAATYNLSLASTGGFSGTVGLSCSGAPAKTACALAPSVTPLGSTPVPVTVTVVTTANALAPVGNGAGGSWPWWPWTALLATMAAALVWVPRRRWVMVGGLELALALGMAACGGAAVSASSSSGAGAGGGGGTSTPAPAPTPAPTPAPAPAPAPAPTPAPSPGTPGTPAGTYKLTITATSNGNTVGSTDLTLVVQ